jgi:hypothetical protein
MENVNTESEEGKWMTVKMTREEVNQINEVKSQWTEMGLTLPFSSILRVIVAKGFDIVEWENLKQNPLQLFQKEPAV